MSIYVSLHLQTHPGGWIVQTQLGATTSPCQRVGVSVRVCACVCASCAHCYHIPLELTASNSYLLTWDMITTHRRCF